MTQAPSIKEALEAAMRAFKACRPIERVACQDFGMQQDDILEQQLEAALSAALATFQPDGERREAIARIIDPHAFIIVNPKRVDMMDRQRWAREKADLTLASGLVQDEAAIRADEREKYVAIISSPPNVPDTHRFIINGEVFKDSRGNELFIAKADAETLLNDFVAAIRSARNGGAES